MPIVILNRATFNGGYGMDPYGRGTFGSGPPFIEGFPATAAGTAAVVGASIHAVANSGYGVDAYGTTTYGGGPPVVPVFPSAATGVGVTTAATVNVVVTSGYGVDPWGTSPYGGGNDRIAFAGGAAGTGSITNPGVVRDSDFQAPVSLVAIDGESIVGGASQSNFTGNGYFTRIGATRALDWTGPNPVGADFEGWDDLNFIPIGNYLADFGSDDGFYDRADDLGLNSFLPASGNVDPLDALARGKAIFLPISDYPTPSTIPAGAEAAVVGCIAGEEPSAAAQFEAMKADNDEWVAAPGGEGHIKYLNFTDNLLSGGVEGVYSEEDMAEAAQWITCDLYFFNSAWHPADNDPTKISLSRYKIKDRLYPDYFVSIGDPFAAPVSVDECARGGHYGSMVDSVRRHWTTTETRPYGTWVECGADFSAESVAITGTQLKWGVWSALVHGARQILYFDHNFRSGDPNAAFCVFNHNHYGGPGIPGTGIYAAAKTVNHHALSIAQVLNSPRDGYFVYGAPGAAIATPGFLTAVTSTNPRGPFSGIEAVCKWHPVEQTHYVLSVTRESESMTNIPATYRMVDQGQVTAHEVFEARNITITRGGSIPAGFCEFTDPFATGASYHCYRIDN